MTMTGSTTKPAPAGPPVGKGRGGFGGASPLDGELVSPEDLARQAKYADSLAEQIEILAGVIRGWAQQLPDRLAQATWGTEGIDRAGNEVAGAADDLPALLEQLRVLGQEIDAAEKLGAEVLARNASGRVEAFAGS